MNLETMRLANWMHMCINTFRHINHRLDREKMKTNTHTHSNTSNNINQLTKSNIYSWAELYRAAIKKKQEQIVFVFLLAVRSPNNSFSRPMRKLIQMKYKCLTMSSNWFCSLGCVGCDAVRCVVRNGMFVYFLSLGRSQYGTINTIKLKFCANN